MGCAILVSMKLFAAVLDYSDIRRKFALAEDFSQKVHRAAAEAADRYAEERVDLREIPFVTIDPAGSMDLDQAVHIELAAQSLPRREGWRVRYAIADVAAFVEPSGDNETDGGPIEAESLRRGQTIYVPDGPVRLHPEELSEDRASLLPEQDRPAVVWDMLVNPDGEVESFDVRRAMVRSVARFDYDEVEGDLRAGKLHPSIALLPEVGQARQGSDLRRQAINLRLPSISVERDDSPGEGSYHLSIDPRQSMDDYNAELSLMAGMCAGRLMVEHGVGILRTLPPADEKALQKFDTAAAALGYERGERPVGEMLAEVDASTPQGMALMRDAQSLLRGAGYQALGFGGEEEEPAIHAGIGGFYAHVTAPLRRLVDRFATEVCLALAAGREIPGWVRAHLSEVLEVMKSSGHLASQVDKACLKLTEAVVLEPWVGQDFTGTVLHSERTNAQVMGENASQGKLKDPGKEASKDFEKPATATIFVETPPVIAECRGNASDGLPEEATSVKVTLVKADPATREILFTWPAD